MRNPTSSLNGSSTYYYVHRREKNGLQAPLKPGKYTMICDVYECERGPRIGEAGEAYRDYALQQGKLVKTSYEKHEVAA